MNLKCLFTGHAETEKYFTETADSIYTKRCSRCKQTVGMPYWKGIKDYPPPNSSKENLAEWKKFCDSEIEDLKKHCKN